VRQESCAEAHFASQERNQSEQPQSYIEAPLAKRENQHMSLALKRTAPATERAQVVNISSREDPEQTQYWTPPESRINILRMEDRQTGEEQLSSLFHTSEYPSRVKKVESALLEARRRRISSPPAYVSTSFKDPDLLEPLVDYGQISLVRVPDMHSYTHTVQHTYTRAEHKQPKITNATATQSLSLSADIPVERARPQKVK